MAVNWSDKGISLSTLLILPATLFLNRLPKFCCVFLVQMSNHAIREYFSLVPSESILLSFDGENYRSIESSKYSHRYTYGLGNYKGKALTVGCDRNYADCSFATEILDIINSKWSDGPDFPLGSK